MSELREIKMGKRETQRERERGEIKEEQHSQCVVSHSHLLSATPGGSMYPTQRNRDRH